MSKSILFLASTVSIFSLVSYAQAQDAVELNRIVIGTEANDDNSVEVTDEDIVRINPTDLQDLFAAEPTIAVGSSLPVSQKLYVNGVEETNLSVSIDGSRQNNKIFHHNATTLIDPSLLKAVSIDPGVAPADAGPGALAGSIQYETKDVGDLLPDGKMFGGFTIGEYSTNGDVFTTSNALYARKDGFEALGFIKYAKGSWQQDGDGVDITGSGTKLLSGLGKIAYQSEIGHRLELSYERVGDDEARPYRANIGAIIGGKPAPLTRNYDLTRQNVALTYTNENPVGLWDPTIQLAYSITNLGIEEDASNIYGETDSINGKIENKFGLDNGSITAGLDFFADSANLQYEDLLNSALNESSTEKAFNIGIYAQARLDITDRFRTSFGARADFQRFEGVNDYKDNASGLSANLSGEFDVTDYLTASAGASHVFGGIPLAENFILNPTWDYSGGFESVTSNNVFAGLNARFGNFNVSGKVFHTAINDARTPSWGAGLALTKDMTSTGFEVGLGYDWGNGFARVGYANIDTKIDGNPSDSYTGNYLTTPIGQIFTLEAAHTFADYGVTIGGSGQIVLEETDDFGGGSTPTTLAGYEVFNAFVEYTPLNYENLTLRAAVNNIFDETYASRATYGQEFLGEVTPLNEPGRSFKLSLKAKF
ncbi:TonB-dependent receptor [Ahrensia kielensis]|uniref:TonB-dependent receptor n=1 Tax=Ahrensia kielensis TaxID=76980 RepID=A0ABU9T673_9HYPH